MSSVLNHVTNVSGGQLEQPEPAQTAPESPRPAGETYGGKRARSQDETAP